MKIRVRPLLATIHLWTGIALCLPLVLLGITGALLVYDHDIEALFGDSPPQIARSNVAFVPVEAQIAAAKTANTDASLIPVAYTPPQVPGDVARVRFGQVGRGGPPVGAVIFVDPTNATVLGMQNTGAGWMRTVHVMHGSLGMRDRTGREIVGWFGVAMLFLGVSGVVMWWPRPGRWAAAFKVSSKARGQRLHRELHGAVGIWSLLVFIIVSFSGTYIVFPETLGTVFGGAPTNAPPPKVEAARDATMLPLDASIEAARAVVGSDIIRLVGPAARRDQPVRVQLARAGDKEGAPTISVFVDPFTARVLDVRDPNQQSTGRIVQAWQRAIHAGRGLGPIWQAAVFISGLLPPLFAITGISMWLLRRRARRATDERVRAALATSS
ncbi:PepSY-associated TM helix domain-containing protein [Roseiterribacter gracilis]|uniref:Membrane protein n=1 Tax=Roseiterribacter gracilis TaxID=2812848 RepID=A0A8S8XK02_9PROT|nr:membrane protein [Rhodospirillales bacterium TMPK1]